MQIAVNIVIDLGVILLLGYSFKLMYSTLRFFNFAHAASLTLGPYFFYTFKILCGIPTVFSFVLSVVAVVSLMLVLNYSVYQPLLNRGIDHWRIMIASLGIYVVSENVISLIWGDATLSFRTGATKAGHLFSGAYIADIQIVTLISCMALLFLSLAFCEWTSIGRKMTAVSSNPQLGSILGVSRRLAVNWSIIIGSSLAACVGILIAADVDMTPTMGFNWLLYGIVAIIIGGMGRIRYLTAGALLLSTAQNLAAYYLDNKWMNATAYIILIVFLFFRPYGFSGKTLKKTSI